MPQLHAYYLEYMNAWRLYDPRYENQTIAYVDSIDELPENTIIDEFEDDKAQQKGNKNANT